MPVVEILVRYLRPATYDDLLTVKTTLREMPVDHRLEFFQEVFNDSGKLLCAGTIKLYFLNGADRSKTNIPEALKEKLQPFFTE